MDSENIITGLEGLSKIDNFTDFLFVLIYWIAVIFIMLFVAYIFVSIYSYTNRKKKGEYDVNKDNYLE